MSVRIKLLRNQHGFSLEQLANKTSLTKSYLSKVERGLSNPSIGAALSIARELGTDVAKLFGTAVDQDLVTLVRKGEGLRINSEEGGARAIDILAAEMPDKKMQPFIITPPAKFADGPKMHGHPGEEFIYVINGQIDIEFPERIEQLKKGDSIYFRAEIPHRIRQAGSKAASALVIISGK